MPRRAIRRKDIIYPDLSYKIIGILFEVWNTAGYGHKESFYQKATVELLKKSKTPLEEQLKVRMKFQDKEIGMYVLDFLITNKIVLEIKKREYFSKKDIEQLYAYLKATGLKLGIIAHLARTGVKFKRVVNLI